MEWQALVQIIPTIMFILVQEVVRARNQIRANVNSERCCCNELPMIAVQWSLYFEISSRIIYISSLPTTPSRITLISTVQRHNISKDKE